MAMSSRKIVTEQVSRFETMVDTSQLKRGCTVKVRTRGEMKKLMGMSEMGYLWPWTIIECSMCTRGWELIIGDA